MDKRHDDDDKTNATNETHSDDDMYDLPLDSEAPLTRELLRAHLHVKPPDGPIRHLMLAADGNQKGTSLHQNDNDFPWLLEEDKTREELKRERRSFGKCMKMTANILAVNVLLLAFSVGIGYANFFSPLHCFIPDDLSMSSSSPQYYVFITACGFASLLIPFAFLMCVFCFAFLLLLCIRTIRKKKKGNKMVK